MVLVDFTMRMCMNFSMIRHYEILQTLHLQTRESLAQIGSTIQDNFAMKNVVRFLDLTFKRFCKYNQLVATIVVGFSPLFCGFSPLFCYFPFVRMPTVFSLTCTPWLLTQYFQIGKTNLECLLQRHVEMAVEITNLDSDLRMLVYENYNKFISATYTIRRLGFFIFCF